ncbi:MAG: hypothetical protein GY804_06110 [Alphaproteobacteria bacterium]|nr:hypothetical protein [Alphaproteobacteria bacterium]
MSAGNKPSNVPKMPAVKEKGGGSFKPEGGESLASVEIFYAKFLCRLGNGGRLKLYKKLASLLRNRFSLMDGLEKIKITITNNGKNPNEPMAVAINCWQQSLQNGNSFSVALKGWAPARERLMLSVGDIANLESALVNVIKVTEGSSRMIGPLIGAIAYPAVLMVMSVAIIAGIGIYMVPPMASAAPNIRWTGQAKYLVDVSLWVQVYWAYMFGAMPVIFLILFFSMGKWKNKLRAYVDGLPPWSMYRIFVGVSWLMCLAALVKAGTPISQAMRSLRSDASPYLLERIDRSLYYINNGENIGEAMLKTEMNFPDREIIADLQIYSELDNFAEALDRMADEWLVDSVSVIEQQAEVLNMVAILFVTAVVAWAVMGTFAMQDQITSAMGI